MLEKKNIAIVLSLHILFALVLVLFVKALNGKIGNMENWRIIFAGIGLFIIAFTLILFFVKKKTS
jgi:phosphoglycerol transferase MdoB-like AlkP superfamily enzyme